MNTKIQVYGSSDDIVVVEGGKLTDEHSAYNCARLLTFDDGTKLRVEYAPPGYGAKWKIDTLQVGTAGYEYEPATDEDNNYSDRVTLTGDITSVKSLRVPASKPSKKEMKAAEAERQRSDEISRAVATCFTTEPDPNEEPRETAREIL